MGLHARLRAHAPQCVLHSGADVVGAHVNANQKPLAPPLGSSQAGSEKKDFLKPTIKKSNFKLLSKGPKDLIFQPWCHPYCRDGDGDGGGGGTLRFIDIQLSIHPQISSFVPSLIFWAV